MFYQYIYTKFTSVVINPKEEMRWATSYYNISYSPPQGGLFYFSLFTSIAFNATKATFL